MAADNTTPFFPAEPRSDLHPFNRRLRTLTPESKFWRSFRSSELASGLIFPVSTLTFSPAAPSHLAAAVSDSVLLFSGPDLAPRPSITAFRDAAYSPSFRCDGALLAAGCGSGVVQVFRPDKPSGAPLRRLRAHAAASRLVRYPRAGGDKMHLFSGGDDALFVYWDVPSESSLVTVQGAQNDYIRAGDASPASPEVFATGSYDHTVKLWDVRVPVGTTGTAHNSVLTIRHEAPVESVLFLPSGALLATAGGNSIKIWDVVGGGRLVHSVDSHVKTVTALAIGRVDSGGDGGGEARLLSVSIDGYLKIFDFSNFKITHSMRYPSQLLSVGFSPSGLVRVAGAANGVIYMGKKKNKKYEDNAVVSADEFGLIGPEPPRHILRPTNFRYFRRGQNEKPREGDFIVAKARKVKLAEHDKLLRKFMHKDALVAALRENNPRSVVAVMGELVARQKLLRSVMNLEVEELGMLLKFLHSYVAVPRYARFLMGLSKHVMEMRAEDVKSVPELSGHVRNIKRVVSEEIQIQRSLKEIQGMISPLLVMATK